GWNFGINENSARLFIVTPPGEIILSENLSITDNSYSYDWVIILDLDDLERNSTFEGWEDWTINITFRDLAGNEGNITLQVMLDNTPPTLEMDDLPDEAVHKQLIINASFNDQETGISQDTLTFTMLDSNHSVLEVFTGTDINEVGDSEASLIIDTSGYDEGEYYIRIQIHDNTGNKRVIDSDYFIIDHPTPPNPFTNILLLLASPVLAFGGGIGLAALYERVKGLRGG
ncbi:MAG: hypothetical protein ACW991_01460, partial [Candidatus Hodarchaeales archaeon]